MCLIRSSQQYSHVKKCNTIRVKRTKNTLHWITSIVLILLFYLTNYNAVAIRKGRLLSPSSFTALSGDLHVQIHYNINDLNDTKNNNFITSNLKENNTISVLVISKYADDIDATTTKTPKNGTEQLLQRQRKNIVQNIPLYNDPRLNVTQIAVPCQTFVRGGGLYEMKVISNLKNTLLPTEFHNVTNDTRHTSMVTTTLIPVEDERLRQILDVRWPSAIMEVNPVKFRTYPDHPVHITLRFPDVNCDKALHLPELPDFWLELVYYGKDRTYSQNTTKSNVLFAEQVRGFPKYMLVQLDCELFGLAGQYAVQLRPMVSKMNVPTIRRFITIDWSDKFVFNVYASSIFPCDPHTGVGVLYEYPNCILEQGDRVRVYAKLRADVASLQPPTSLHYISEQRVIKSQHALYFSCELFSERYVEYCFSYVSQAISGAVADVRMDCVPTLPVSDSDTGGWGPWSDWTPCSSNCLGGTRNRYRFCDSPPPRYGAKFCDGNSVETEKCGDSLTNTWSCIYQSNSGNSKIDLNHTAIISQEIGPGCRCGCIVHLGSSKPKRIIAGSTQSCPGRSFWLIQVDGKNNIAFSLNFLRLPCNLQYIKLRDGPSLSSTLLIELNGGNLPITYGDEKKSNSRVIAHLQTTGAQLLIEFYSGVSINNNTSNIEDIGTHTCIGGFLANVEQIAQTSKNGTTTLLAGNKIRIKNNINTIAQKSKYRTKFTLVHLSAVIFAAIIILISALLGAQYIVRYRKYHLAIAQRRDEGSRLHTPHASMNSLHPPSRALSTTTLLSEVIYLVKMRPKHKLRHSILRESIDAETITRETEFADGKLDVILSQMTKCEEEIGSNGTLVALRNGAISPSHSCILNRSVSNNDNLHKELNRNVNVEESVDVASSVHSSTLTHNTTKDSESIISSGMSSLYNSPPSNTKFCTGHYDICTTKTINSCLDEYHLQQYNIIKRSSKLDHERKEFYSPIAASLFSSTNITAINIKENKEQQNRRKLLTRPSSEFSIVTQQELEIDYYDYNVINAGAAPGSYLGMDPAYLVWIPPFEDIAVATDKILSPLNDQSTSDFNEIDPMYEKLRERMPKYYLSPRSNSESRTNTPINQTTLTTPSSDELSINVKNQDVCLIKALPKQTMSYLQGIKGRTKHSKSTLSLRPSQRRSDVQAIQLNELNCRIGAPAIISTSDDVMTNSYVEKETRVVKSPSDLQHFLILDDIQFADESENDSMNDSNVHTSLSESKLHKNINSITTDICDNTVTGLSA